MKFPSNESYEELSTAAKKTHKNIPAVSTQIIIKKRFFDLVTIPPPVQNINFLFVSNF